MTKFQDCMSRELKKRMKLAKTKKQRQSAFSAAAKACKGKSGSSKPKPRATKKTTPKVKPRGVKTTSKPKPKSRPKGDQERKMLKFKKEFDDIARGLGIPSSKTKFKFVGKKWNLKIGSLRMVKRVKLSEAMKIVRKRAKSRV